MKRFVLLSGLLALSTMLVTSCFRNETRTARIRVPEISDSRIRRIITNSVANEISGIYDPGHKYRVDLAHSSIIYHEGWNLPNEVYQTQIMDEIRRVGYKSEFLVVGRLPPERCEWRNQHIAVIRVPQMKSNRDANIVIDAIARARARAENPNITFDLQDGVMEVTYDGSRTALKNLEFAIANVGYHANDVEPLLGRAEAMPKHWM